MKTHRPAFLVTLALLLASLAPADATTLTGGVSHSESLPPLRNNRLSIPLRGKVDYAPAQSPTSQRAILWLPVPAWLAGKWVKQGDLTVSYTDVRTGISTPTRQWTQNFQTTTWGNQLDGQGNIWHGYSIPTEIDGISKGKTVRFIMVNGQREQSSSDHMVTRVHSVVIENLDGQLVDTFQQETLNDLFLLPSGELENHGSTRDFTSEGQPVREGMLVSHFSKVRNFELVETQNGVDLLKSLNDYLRANNMSQLVRTVAP